VDLEGVAAVFQVIADFDGFGGDVFLTGKEFYVSGEASGGGAGANSQYGSLQTIPANWSAASM